MERTINSMLSIVGHMVQGDVWYQGDHWLVLLNEDPVRAIKSARLGELMARFTHSPRDTVVIVDTGKLATFAEAIQALFVKLDWTAR